MSSNLRIRRVCHHCGKEFEARTLQTRYCSHDCNRKHYKLVKREEKLKKFLSGTVAGHVPLEGTNKSKPDLEKFEEIQKRDYLSIAESAIYLGVSKRTIERSIASGNLKVVRLGHRVIVPRESINKMLGL